MEEMVKSPYATESDTYYFVQDKLVMHNKVKLLFLLYIICIIYL